MTDPHPLAGIGLKNPTNYAGQSLCPRCGDGWPNCVDLQRATGIRPDEAHATTCAIYTWSAYTCGRCTLELALKRDDLREDGLNA